MAQQENKKYKIKLGKDLIDRKNSKFLIAKCPNCGALFDVGKVHYRNYLATYCPYCNTFIHYDK